MPSTVKQVHAIRHVAFEDLGAFAPAFASLGYAMQTFDAGVDDLAAVDPLAADVMVVLGGPIGAGDDALYPFLADELRLIESRLRAGRPIIGVCLGAQLIARALGARVYPSGHREIGFAPIQLTPAGRHSCLAAFADAPTTLHWHGDTFDLPAGAELLASTELCRHQAFSFGQQTIAFQFHPEAGGAGFERWLVGHAVELTLAGIDVPALRAQARQYGAELSAKAGDVLRRWLAQLPGR